MRFEKKFTFSLTELDEVRDLILTSNLAFKKVYTDRFINSLYLDTYNLDNYEDNLAGLSNRSKARIRWYSKSANEPFSLAKSLTFEIKLRSNAIGKKLSHIINFKNKNLLIAKNNQKLMKQIRELVPKSFLPYIDGYSEFSLLSSYNREYFEDQTGQFRITLDSSLTFSKVNLMANSSNFNLEKISTNYGVLEVKLPLSFEKKIYEFEKNIRLLRPGRHSKYAVGINLIYNN